MDFPFNDENFEAVSDLFAGLRGVSKGSSKPIIHLPIMTNKKKIFKKRDSEDYSDLIYFINQDRHTREKYRKMSDFFQEHHRVCAKKKNAECSPFEYWERNKTAILERVTDHNDATKLRKQIRVKECTTFSPFVTRAVQRIFRPKRILDFSAGWGDRLIGFMTADAWIDYYCGIDPNKKLHPGYELMITSLLPKSSQPKYQMIVGNAEDEELQIPLHKNRKFDLIFTSPPFFDWEEYTSDDTQSIKKFPNFDAWYDNFLLRAIANVTDKLEIDGHLVLNISNIPEHKILDRLLKDIPTLVHPESKEFYLKFQGIIWYGALEVPTERFQPILVWQKRLAKVFRQPLEN